MNLVIDFYHFKINIKCDPAYNKSIELCLSAFKRKKCFASV